MLQRAAIVSCSESILLIEKYITNLDVCCRFDCWIFILAVGIRYGKYCGVGWSGCPGEKPCDDLDACCKIHDECVEKKGTVSSNIVL